MDVCSHRWYVQPDGNADEAEWVKTEREQFVEFWDKNRDGKMDEEDRSWILPQIMTMLRAEARPGLIKDQNKVGLTRPKQSSNGPSLSLRIA